jgi:prepilin-type N-terminal cleavage/methylation domain-containing protein
MKPNKNPCPSKRGFTFVEVIVSLVVLTALAAGIFATVSYTKRMSLRAEEKTVAISLVEKKLNELKDNGASGFDPVVGSPTPYTQVESILGLLTNGTRTTSVTEPETNLKEVLVTVTWTDKLGQTRSESAVTAIYGTGT